MKKYMLVTLLAILVSSSGYAQEYVEGKVMSFKGFAIKNALVTTKRAKAETRTDSLGHFRIEVKGNDLIRVKALGFQNGMIGHRGKENVTLNLIYNNDEWSYNKIIDLGHMSKKDLDYCIENLLDENNNFDRMADIFQVIQSVYPPAKVDELNGRKTIFLNSRGATSVYADQDALLVVDGVITQNISGIHPTKVKAVKVLVGTETSFYGTRGANGVVEILLKNN